MASSRVFELYLQVGHSPKENSFCAKVFPGRPNDFVAKGAAGEPIVLIANAGGRTHVAPLTLPNLLVEYAVPMEVRHDDGVTHGAFIILAANHARPDLYEPFCRMVEATVSGLSLTPSVVDVDRTVQSLIELFRAASLPSRKTVAGLWGELMLIDATTNLSAAIDAWHVTPFDNFDFVLGDRAIEVKATERSERIHEFGHAQLRNAAGKNVVVISAMLRRSSTGSSCQDLVDSILQRLGRQEARLKLLRVVSESLGMEIQDANEVRFDRSEAINLLRQVAADRLPAVTVPEHSGISNVRYSINLDAIVPQVVLGRVDCAELFAP